MHQSYIITVQKKTKNKNLQKALESDIAITLLSKLKKNYLPGKMFKGITNFQIETAL